MKIIQELTPGVDCPEELAGDPRFRKKIEEVTRRRLELRPGDDVVVKFV